MNNGERRGNRRPDRRDTGPSIQEAISRLGSYGAELAESLAWCSARGMEGLAEFYQHEIWYRYERLPRKRRPRVERQDVDQEPR
jgi:hypothetical protein